MKSDISYLAWRVTFHTFQSMTHKWIIYKTEKVWSIYVCTRCTLISSLLNQTNQTAMIYIYKYTNDFQ